MSWFKSLTEYKKFSRKPSGRIRKKAMELMDRDEQMDNHIAMKGDTLYETCKIQESILLYIDSHMDHEEDD